MAYPYDQIVLYVKGDIPGKYCEYIRIIVLADQWQPYSNLNIRNLSSDDEPLIQDCCKYDPDDKFLGQLLAEQIRADKELWDIRKGYFHNGKLCGLVAARFIRELHVTNSSLFVSREYQNKGIGTQLMMALCSEDSAFDYGAACFSFNIPSLRAVEKAGFTKVGEQIIIRNEASFPKEAAEKIHEYKELLY